MRRAWEEIAESLGFARQDCRALLMERATSSVLVWGNLRAHMMRQLKDFIAERSDDWLTVFHFPT